MSKPDQAAYVPGVCNINSNEIAYRKRVGNLGAVIFIALLIILLVLNVSHYFRLLLFLPALLAATGYLQARNKFCVGYAASGEQNAVEGSKQAAKVRKKADLAADKAKAKSINNQAFIYALALTVIASFLPHI